MGRAIRSDPTDQASCNLADGHCPAVALHRSRPLQLPLWRERMRKTTQKSGHFVQNPDTLSAREIEIEVSRKVLAIVEHRFPRHTDKHLARATNATVEAMAKALQRGRLRLGYVLMLAATLGPDVWEAIYESVDERLAACRRMEAEAKQHLSQEEHQNRGDGGTDT